MRAKLGHSTRAASPLCHANSALRAATATLDSQHARFASQEPSIRPPEATAHRLVLSVRRGRPILPREEALPALSVLLEATAEPLAYQPALFVPWDSTPMLLALSRVRLARPVLTAPTLGQLQLSRANRASIVRVGPQPQSHVLQAATARTLPDLQHLVLKTRSACRKKGRPRRYVSLAVLASNPALGLLSALRLAFQAPSTSRPSTASPLKLKCLLSFRGARLFFLQCSFLSRCGPFTRSARRSSQPEEFPQHL